MDSSVEIGKRLKEFRKKQKITQQQMAFLLQISRNTLLLCEKGEANLNMQSLIFMGNFLGMDLNWLITGKAEQNHTDLTAQELLLIRTLRLQPTEFQEQLLKLLQTLPKP